MEIRERIVYDLFNNVDYEFAKRVAEGIGVEPPKEPGDELPDHDREDPSLSMANRTPDTIETRKIAVLVDEGFDDEHVTRVQSELDERGARVELVSEVLGEKEGEGGETVEADKSHVTTESVLYDALLVPGGEENVDALLEQGDAKHFVAEAFKHKKPVGALGEGTELLREVDLPDVDISDDEQGLVSDHGVVTDRSSDDLDSFVDAFVDAVAEHRHWQREDMTVPA